MAVQSSYSDSPAASRASARLAQLTSLSSLPSFSPSTLKKASSTVAPLPLPRPMARDGLNPRSIGSLLGVCEVSDPFAVESDASSEGVAPY
jgi:hypothetical protein